MSTPSIPLPPTDNVEPIDVQKALKDLLDSADAIEKYITVTPIDNLNNKRIKANIDFIDINLANSEINSALVNPDRSTVLTAKTNGENFLNNNP